MAARLRSFAEEDADRAASARCDDDYDSDGDQSSGSARPRRTRRSGAGKSRYIDSEAAASGDDDEDDDTVQDDTIDGDRGDSKRIAVDKKKVKTAVLAPARSVKRKHHVTVKAEGDWPVSLSSSSSSSSPSSSPSASRKRPRHERKEPKDLKEHKDRSAVPGAEPSGPDESEPRLFAQLDAEGLRVHLEDEAREKKAAPPLFTGDMDTMEDDELLASIQLVYDKWKDPSLHVNETTSAYARKIFSLDTAWLSPDDIEKAKTRLKREIGVLQMHCMKRQWLDKDHPKSMELQKQFNEMWELLKTASMCLLFETRLANLRDANRSDASHGPIDLFAFKPINYSDLTPTQSCILYCLGLLGASKYRKEGDMVCAEIITPEGYHTKVFPPLMTIESWVLKVCDKNDKFDQWSNVTTKSTLSDVVKYLTKCEDSEFSRVESQRYVSSWRDGLWFSWPKPAFVPYSAGPLPTEVTSCVYHDMPFDHTDIKGDFMNIEHPIKTILTSQGYNAYEQSFVFAMAGRLVVEPGLMDEWEVVMMLWGGAGGGKSTFVDAVSLFFRPEDVQALSNTIEKNFGLQAAVGKKLLVAPDIKKKFGLDSGDLQTMTSLERMAVNIKYGSAVTFKWNIGAIFAGNEFPENWRDKLGSLARRLMLIPFPVFIGKKRDNKLKKAVPQKVAQFYRLCVLAYHWWTSRINPVTGCRFGDEDIWLNCPKKMRDAQQVIRQEGNPLEEFINAPEVVTSTEARYCQFGYFVTRYKEYSKYWEKRGPSMSMDDIKQHLKSRGFRVDFMSKKWPFDAASETMDTFISGLELLPKPETSSDGYTTTTAHSYGGDGH